MLISPPFLPERNANESDTDWIERAMKQPPGRMAGTNALEGSFPVSAELQWHNGQHIKAPQGADGNALPIRAVADGTVVFVNLITSANTENQDPNHGQNYLPDKTQSAWTDNGCIILEHTGEIGADGTKKTSFTYYSLYMHLREIKLVHEPEKKDRRGRVTQAASDRDLKVGERLYRKDELGRAGKVYGLDNCLHFEIALGEQALGTLLGKTWNKAPAWKRDNPADTPAADGRTDSVFGSVYIYLPANTPASVQAPTAHTRQPSQTSVGQPLWLRIEYDKGQCRYQSFNAQGRPTTPDPVAEAQADYEYNLYTEANRRHNSLSAADQANSSPSGWYELLRFGRNLGPDRLPAQAAHWRQIPGPSGQPMWVDLNAQGSYKFSDADFLPVMGWNCYDDDSNSSDQRCDSGKLKARMRARIEEQDTTLDERTLLRRHLGDDRMRQSMRRAICSFPTEWDRSSIQTRYQWQRDPTLSFKLNIEENWQRFVKHLKAITFDDLPQDYKDAIWHVHPMQFIAHMRKCGWLSANELAQCFPRKLQHLVETAFHTTTFAWTNASARASTWSLPFSTINRKYGIDQRQRLVHYFSHVIPETGYLAMMKEGDSKDGTYLRGKKYYPYYGRGLIQLTWAETYKKYGTYRGFSKTEQPPAQYHEAGWNPDVLIAQNNTNYNANNCADSAGYYVVSHATMLRKMDMGITKEDAIAVSRCVNGDVSIQNLNGLDARLQSVVYLKYFLLDYCANSATERLSFDWRRNSSQEPTGRLNKQGHPIKAFIKTAQPWQIDVLLEKQRP